LQETAEVDYDSDESLSPHSRLSDVSARERDSFTVAEPISTDKTDDARGFAACSAVADVSNGNAAVSAEA